MDRFKKLAEIVGKVVCELVFNSTPRERNMDEERDRERETDREEERRGERER